MKSTVIVAGSAVMVAACASLALALTPEQKCQDGIAGAARKYFDARYKVQSKCHDSLAKTGAPADCTTDPDVITAIATAETKLDAKITAKCPGVTVLQADLGLACRNALTVSDVVDCIVDDVHGPGADLLIDTAYHDSGQIADVLLQKCQKTIGKAVRKGAGARLKVRAKCAKPIAQVDNPPTRCPDAKAHEALDKARVKLVTLVEAKCTDAQVLDAAQCSSVAIAATIAPAPRRASSNTSRSTASPPRATTPSRRARGCRAASPRRRPFRATRAPRPRTPSPTSTSSPLASLPAIRPTRRSSPGRASRSAWSRSRWRPSPPSGLRC